MNYIIILIGILLIGCLITIVLSGLALRECYKIDKILDEITKK